MPWRPKGDGLRARKACLQIIARFGYLQLDTVSIAGARSHAIVLLSRLPGLGCELPEKLLQPDGGLFEYWGHEASWIPLSLYSAFAFRREEYRQHPWWGNVLGEHPRQTAALLRRIEDEGPLRSLDLEGRGSRGWWDLKLAKRIATALWSSGRLAIRERNNFQRSFDLAERVIPAKYLNQNRSRESSLDDLLLKALEGHGWATAGTLARTWRLKNRTVQISERLLELEERGVVGKCRLLADDRHRDGWILPADLSLASRLRGVRPRSDQGVLLSPFDPVLWDRQRVGMLFGFDQLLEIFKPAAERKYGYYCLPVLAGENLVARVDLKAHRRQGKLTLLCQQFETAYDQKEIAHATRSALQRYACSVGLHLS